MSFHISIQTPRSIYPVKIKFIKSLRNVRETWLLQVFCACAVSLKINKSLSAYSRPLRIWVVSLGEDGRKVEFAFLCGCVITHLL